MANASQGIYTPLPQSLSDSDSEKENQIENMRWKYSNRKQQNGIHFDRNNSNGYMIPTHMLNMSKSRGFSTMSFTRKCSFMFSIMACFLTIVVFLWVLPCSETLTCPLHISSWENQHDDIEFKGRINVVSSVFKSSHNLALLFKRSLNLPDSRNGAISILGNNGNIAWFIQQIKPPSDLNCYIIDVNNDGIKDCLLLGEMGLEAIDSISGDIIWHLHTNMESKLGKSIDFPFVASDLNRDGVNDLITIMDGKTFHNNLITICGKTGLVLDKIDLKHCLGVHGLKYEEEKFFYSCRNITDIQYYQIPLMSFEKRLHNKSFEVDSVKVIYNYEDEMYILSNHKLTVTNIGICPDCHATVILVDNQNKQLWSLSHVNSYAMKPTAFAFKSTDSNISSLKGHINGFILKLWQWKTYKSNKNFDVPQGHLSNVNSTIQVNFINESVILITFNDTNVHVINASMTNVTQLCFPLEDDYNCQPDLANQNESLLISDLDSDGSQELISYSSTFVLRDDNWRLISSMKVIRLEAELPKLYEVA